MTQKNVKRDLQDLYWRLRQIDEAIRSLERFQQIRRERVQALERDAIAA